MSEHEKPLPRPPKTPFGRKKPFEEDGRSALKADEMAMAAAEGRLEEYMKAELPDDENARKLAMMMMGMTGMMPQGMSAPAERQEPAEVTLDPAAVPPDDLVSAAVSGDVANLVDLLRREHLKRTGETGESSSPSAPEPQQELTTEEKDLLGEMMRLAEEQKLSPDWIISRALRLYLDEYKKTGRL